MNAKELLCMLNGHKWKKTQVRADMVTEMVCRRCGEIRSATDERGPLDRTGYVGGPGDGGFAGGFGDGVGGPS